MQPEDQVGVELGERAGPGGQDLEEDAADDRAHQRAEAADDDPDDDLGAVGQREHGRADEDAVGEQDAGETGEEAAHGEDRELDEADVVAQQLGAKLVLAHGHDDAAEGGEEEELAGEIGGRRAAMATMKTCSG